MHTLAACMRPNISLLHHIIHSLSAFHTLARPALQSSIEASVKQVGRANAIQALSALLKSPEGAAAAIAQLRQLWPQALGLLSEPALIVRQNATLAVGLLGAIASTSSAPEAQGGAHPII